MLSVRCGAEALLVAVTAEGSDAHPTSGRSRGPPLVCSVLPIVSAPSPRKRRSRPIPRFDTGARLCPTKRNDRFVYIKITTVEESINEYVPAERMSSASSLW